MQTLGPLLLSAVVAAAAASPVSLPLTFEPNVGQTDARVKYMARSGGATLWLTPEGATLSLKLRGKRGALKLLFVDGDSEVRIEGESLAEGVSNYLLGRDASHWRTSVPRFAKVRYRNIYPGIDAVFYGNPQQLEYDLILNPGARPDRIDLAFDGADSVSLDARGDLIVRMGDAELHSRRPYIFQMTPEGERSVNGRYVMRTKNDVGFMIDAYDTTRPLIVDPVLTYATYLGGSGGDFGLGIAMDSQGNLYVTGGTDSSNFPVKSGISTGDGGQTELAFVSKINPNTAGGASLVFSTYFGGLNNINFDYDTGVAIGVDSSNNVYVGGFTYSPDFPLQNAFQTTFNTSLNCADSSGDPSTCAHGFISKLASTGASLVYSSYLGGTDYDSVNALAVDAGGNAYLSGETDSSNFLTAGSPFQSKLNGTSDGFLSKVSPSGTLLYSTYFGGEKDDVVNGMAVDSSGIVYLAGQTNSTQLPVTATAYQHALAAKTAAFVAKLNPSVAGSGGLVYSSYLGGTNGDAQAWAIATDGAGNIYVTGSTESTTYPVSTGAIQAFQPAFAGELNDGTFSGVPGDAFVTVLNPSAQGGLQLTYSTYLGGENDEQGLGIAVDPSGHVTVAGGTNSTAFPTTFNAYEPYYYGVQDSRKGFIARFDPTQSGAASLLYSTLLGGTNDDMFYAMAMSANGNIVAVTGEVYSEDSPVTPSGFQTAYGGTDGVDGDAYIARLDFSQAGPVIFSTNNGAIFNAASNVDAGISPGMLFTLYGSGLGPATGQSYQPQGGRVPTQLAGAQVLVNGFAAPLLYVSSAQINAIVPYEVAGAIGSFVNVQAIYNGVPGNIPNDAVNATAPGIFVLANSNDQGAILNQNNSVNGTGNPAAPGSVIQIFATGEGAITPAGVDGLFPATTLPVPIAHVSVTINGAPATVNYAGTAPGFFEGFLQVNAVVPSGVSGIVPVVLTIGGTATAPVNLSVH